MRTDVATVVDQSAVKNLKGTLKRLNKLKHKYHGKNLRAGTVKIFADGVMEYPGQTAAMLKPYLHNVGTDQDPKWVPSNNRGILQVAQKPFNRIATFLDRHGWQIHVHAIGDRAVRTALNAFAAARKANHRSGWGNRDTIAHLQVIDPKDIPRFAKLHVIPNFEMQWFQRDGYTIDAVKDYIGPKRFKWMYPARSIINSGARMAAGSDWPVDPLFPFYALEKGVTRTADSWYGYDNGPLNAQQSISLGQAIRAYTMGSAFQLGQERSTGSIQKGKQADLIELDRNLFRIKAGQISETNVLRTMIGGKTVYKAK
jgi:predicted amidohydrolase YtcJ